MAGAAMAAFAEPLIPGLSLRLAGVPDRFGFEAVRHLKELTGGGTKAAARPLIA
jgi:hypothetical protein